MMSATKDVQNFAAVANIDEKAAKAALRLGYISYFFVVCQAKIRIDLNQKLQGYECKDPNIYFI